jgi:hypothetical protein
MALKASNVVSNPVTLHRIWWILTVRRIDDLVFGTPAGNRICLWPSTSKHGSLTLNASSALIGHHKSILLPADEEIIGSSWCVCYRICQGCTHSLLWDLEKCYYAAHVWYICSCICVLTNKTTISSWISCAVYPFWVYGRSVGYSNAWCTGVI